MRAFVIRGFDKKNGVDFERVHQELIAPALAAAGIDGGDTTKVIVQAGSIHRDMFRELVMADIVVADVSLPTSSASWPPRTTAGSTCSAPRPGPHSVDGS